MVDRTEINDQPDVFGPITPHYDLLKQATPERVNEGGYYGLPILKSPFWKGEIALYFFFEGVSGGAYVLCTVAELIGKDRFRESIRIGRYLSFVTMLVCPPLLIADLGRPERFHHMLRIFKKTSPMNHGAWALSGFGLVASLLALLESPTSKVPFGRPLLGFLQRYLSKRLMGVFGLPFALTMVSYPGVLLATTANPLWARSHFLGPLFACSSMSSASAALTLCNYASDSHAVHNVLSRFEDIATAAEGAALSLYFGTAREAAQPLIKGKQSKLFLFGAVGAGLILPTLLRRSRSKLMRSGVAPLLTVLGSAALKWSITHAGQESALDPELANQNAPTKSGEPFWGPKQRVAVPLPPQ